MKKTVHPFALAALLAPSLLLADTVEVTFDAALTNETGWVYSDIATDKDGNIYFKLSSSVQSPTFSFNITSVEITLSCTSTEPSRILQIIPSSGEATNAASVAKASTKETQIFEFDKTDTARSFSIRLTGSSNTGNWYIYSAVISGVPIIDAPTNLQADDIKGTRFRLSWTNPENAASNRITVSRIIQHEAEGTTLAEYNFNEFSNGGRNPIDITDDFTNAIPAFAGSSLIYLPTNSAGKIQISTDSQKGYLVHSGFADCSEVAMLLSLKIPNDSQGKTFGIGYETAAGATNEVAAIPMSLEFKTNLVSLADLPADTPLIFNTQGANSKRRVVVDYLAFVRGYSPEAVETNLVKTAFVTDSTTYSVRGLCPRTEYVARITAFDADGNESSPSEPLAVTTNGEAIPFSIHIN